VDLPGTYSLTAFSLEEVIARDFIINEQPDVVVTVVDSSNLERNLYLTLQILELGAPVVVALNMSDLAEGRGLKIDYDRLSQALQVCDGGSCGPSCAGAQGCPFIVNLPRTYSVPSPNDDQRGQK
jgi:hypothetical protein